MHNVPHSEETKLRLRNIFLGTKRDEATKSKISAALVGRIKTLTPLYRAVHKRMNKIKINECLECGFEGKTEMALIHGLGNLICKYQGSMYSINMEDYMEMCMPCHRKYDRGKNE